MSGRYTTSNPYGIVFGASLIILVGLVVVGIGGVVYFQLYPEIEATNRNTQGSVTSQSSQPLDSILKTLWVSTWNSKSELSVHIIPITRIFSVSRRKTL